MNLFSLWYENSSKSYYKNPGRDPVFIVSGSQTDVFVISMWNEMTKEAHVCDYWIIGGNS